MEKILFNLALIDLINFCKENKIDCSGTHLVKSKRKFIYALHRDCDNAILCMVQFHKNGVPTHSL